jgi:hypothetical protein
LNRHLITPPPRAAQALAPRALPLPLKGREIVMFLPLQGGRLEGGWGFVGAVNMFSQLWTH